MSAVNDLKSDKLEIWFFDFSNRYFIDLFNRLGKCKYIEYFNIETISKNALPNFEKLIKLAITYKKTLPWDVSWDSDDDNESPKDGVEKAEENLLDLFKKVVECNTHIAKVYTLYPVYSIIKIDRTVDDYEINELYMIELFKFINK